MRMQKIAIVTALALPFTFPGSHRLSFAQEEAQEKQEPSCVQLENCEEERPLEQTTLTDVDDHDLNNIPHEYGHGDGVKAAHEDLRKGLAPDPNRHHEFRDPWEIKRLRAPYQYGFIDGYNEAYRAARREKRHQAPLPDGQ